MGFRVGDEKLLYAPLDWIGFHYYTRRVVSDASKEKFQNGGNFSGTEIESNSPGGRDPYTRFRAVMPTEGPLTEAGLEVWPRGIYDLVTKISHDYSHPIIEITESGCGYLDSPDEQEHGRVPDARRIRWYRETLGELARAVAEGARVRAYHAWTLLDNFQGRGLHRAIWADLHRLPQPKTHHQGFGPLVRPSRGLEPARYVGDVSGSQNFHS